MTDVQPSGSPRPEIPRPLRRSPQGGRRSKNPSARPHRIKFLVDDQELASVQVAARRCGLSLGAFAATATLSHADGSATAPAAQAGPSVPVGRLMEATAAVIEQRRRLIIAGDLLNQIARRVNSTGVVGRDLHGVLRYVDDATRRADEALAGLRAAVREYTAPGR